VVRDICTAACERTTSAANRQHSPGNIDSG
jgi:hypothetical protein